MDVTKLLLLSSKLGELSYVGALLFYFLKSEFSLDTSYMLTSVRKQDRSLICSILPKFDHQLFVDLCVFHKLGT